MKFKFIIFIFAVILSMNLISSLDSLGEFEPNTNITIVQICYGATFVNITSIQFPNGTRVLINEEMEKDGDYFYYFSDTSQKGRYDVRGISDGCEENFAYYFYIGKRIGTGESVMYVLFTGLVALFWVFLLFLIASLPNENSRDESGVVIGVVRLKYVRILVIALAYMTTLILLNMSTGLAINYTDLSMFANIMGFIFQTMVSLAWTFMILLCLWMFYMLIQDSNINKNLTKSQNFRI